MHSEPKGAGTDLAAAFRDYEDQLRITHTRVGCVLVFLLMPAGSLLDWYVYQDKIAVFFQVRLLCSAVALGILGVLFTPVGKRLGRVLGVIVPMLPVVSIAWMIANTEGFGSPYYAGLNLVLLAVATVLHWTTLESILAVTLCLGIYLVACLAHQGASTPPSIIFNNLYFILLMDIIVVVGTYFQSRLRFREFSLRHELVENRQKLEESHRKLVELDQIKSRFFANISHELRTPLTLLLAPLEALLGDRARPLDNQAREWLQTMHANGMRLLKLINDLLDLVRLESSKLKVKRESVNVSDFLHGLSISVQKVVVDKRLALRVGVAENVGSILTDRDKLEKVVLNLVFNAIKFTPSGGSIEVTAVLVEDSLEIKVSDTGVGISSKNLPHIFDRFWQADTSSQRKYQGAGIGLALVKELVEVQGGSVSADSVEGKGTQITVRLPYMQAAKAEEKAPESAEEQTGATPSTGVNVSPVAVAGFGSTETEEWLSGLYRRAELFPSLTSLQETLRPPELGPESQKPKALIADDEPDMLRFLKSQLDPHFQVLEAVDGAQAVEKAMQFLPDIILSDMMMPEKDGLQVCKDLRERTSTQNIPIILLTARADEETKMMVLEAGASDFLSKPFSTTELHVRMRNLVNGHHFQRKLARQNQILEATLEQLKETEIQLVQSEKLASLGRMSAGIIHEINNPLNFAKTGLYMIRQKGAKLAPEEKADFDEIARDIEEGIDRVRNIVSDLKSFTRQGADNMTEVKVQKIVTAALRFLSHEWRDRVEVDEAIPENLAIHADQNQIVQVLVNLLQNALDATKRKKFENDKPRVRIEGREEGNKKILLVEDNGEGISAVNMDKIFDPFFTTKDVGEGMGLGLSICYKIMENHGGKILVKSEVGKYCQFRLEFPVKTCEKNAD